MPSRPADPRPPRAATIGRLALVVASTLTGIGLAGCMVGERPSFEQAPTAAGVLTGDPNIDAVLGLLDSVDSAVFSATYEALLVFNGTQSSVTAAQASSTQRSMTIGDVRYVTDQNGTRTCSVAANSCTPVVNAAAVSDTGVTPEFVFGDVAKRLRRDADARIGPSAPSTTEIAGEQATCVDVPLSGGTKQYCALSNGVLARFVGADVTVDMTSYQRIVDPTLFTP